MELNRGGRIIVAIWKGIQKKMKEMNNERKKNDT